MSTIYTLNFIQQVIQETILTTILCRFNQSWNEDTQKEGGHITEKCSLLGNVPLFIWVMASYL